MATIVKEIKYWKEHKLLPEVQCDFLLALYTQGDDEQSTTSRKRRKNYFFYVQLFLLVLMVPFSFLVVYFTQFHFILQLSILLICIGYGYFVYRACKKRTSPYRHIAIIIPLVLGLMTTDHLTNVFHFNQLFTLIALIMNFVGWYLLSRTLRLKYLLISSYLALIVLLFVNFSHLFSFN